MPRQTSFRSWKTGAHQETGARAIRNEAQSEWRAGHPREGEGNWGPEVSTAVARSPATEYMEPHRGCKFLLNGSIDHQQTQAAECMNNTSSEEKGKPDTFW